MDATPPSIDFAALTLAVRAEADRIYGQVSRLLDERTTNQASATTVLVYGLHEDLAANTEALNQLSAQIAGLTSQIAELISQVAELSAQVRPLPARLDVVERMAHTHGAAFFAD